METSSSPDGASAPTEPKPPALFMAFWLACALIMFLLAAWKTRELTALKELDAETFPVGIYGAAARDDAVSQIQYEAGPHGRAWRVYLPDATKTSIEKDSVVILPGTLSCVSGKLMEIPVKHGKAHDQPVSVIDTNFKADADTVEGLLIQDVLSKFFQYNGASFTCRIDAPLEREKSYADRALSVRYLPKDEAEGIVDGTGNQYAMLFLLSRAREPKDLTFGINVEHSRAVQIFGGVTQSASTTLLQPGVQAEVEFEDDELSNRRDAGFVVVGALIALGAAMAIEALRPLVESLARKFQRASR